ncbi:MAG TPA: LegC family aminotransferase, partial [bacterium]|nr:LegC family aminotransferase [bacterium]
KYVLDTIDSTFVSSVGTYVTKFEDMIKEYTGCKHAIATSNGTTALHLALLLAGVKREHEVITQPLTFVATCNAISYCGATPVFVDVDKETLGLSPVKLREFLSNNCKVENGQCVNKVTGKTVRACVPMHTFGHSARIEEIRECCDEYNVILVEDAAESIGSKYRSKHTGRFGKLGILSFNGNKTITCGGGRMIMTDDQDLAKLGKHVSTTAKVPHKWDFVHDMLGYNYRLPNINAALACAQMEQLDLFIKNKRELASAYEKFFGKLGVTFIKEPKDVYSNYWLNGIILKDKKERDDFLKFSNDQGVMTRPIWTLMSKLNMYKGCVKGDLSNSEWLEDRVVNIPSSVVVKK